MKANYHELDHHALAQASEEFADLCQSLAVHKVLKDDVQAGQFNFGQFAKNFSKLLAVAEPYLEIAIPQLPGPTGAILTELLPLLKKLGGASVTPTE